jgi:hypothetical protein
MRIVRSAEYIDHRMNVPLRSLGFSFLFATAWLAPSAQAQLMQLNLESSDLEADFYSYNVTLPPHDSGQLQHYRHPIAGTMHLKTLIDLGDLAAPGTLGISFWGNAEDIGDFAYELGSFTATRQPSGAIDLWENTWEEGGPLNLVFGLTINPDLTVVATHTFEFRTYLPDGPGEFWGDSTLWADFDRITLTPVTLTPVPEPSVYGAIAGEPSSEPGVRKRTTCFHRCGELRGSGPGTCSQKFKT